MAHSKRNTSLAFFTSHERSLLKSTWGSQATRLSRDSFLPFASCQLCLQIARDPVACASDGDIFCRECIVNNLLAQRKEIKRLEKEDARRRKEEEEEARTRGEEEKGRTVEEFERVMMGMEGAVKKGPKENQVGMEDGAGKKDGQGTKRKFELDEDEMLKNAVEERAKARKALDEEKAAKPSLPSFWVPSLTPSSAKDLLLKPPKLSPLCPASAPGHSHPLSLKSLVPITFSTSPSASESPFLICPACNKALSNTIKAVLTIPCGHVLCKPCGAKFMSPAKGPPDPHASTEEQQDHNRVLCYVCETNLTGDRARINSKGKGTRTKEGEPKPGLVEIKSEGTGFAGGGKNMATKQGVAFQC